MKPRHYQHACRQAVADQFQNGTKSTLVVMPTGSGKTCTACMIIQDFLPKRTMFIGHRRELLFQTQQTIQRMAGIEVGIEMADLSTSEGFFKVPVVCAMVQTLIAKAPYGRRMGRFDPKEFGLLICDECHHSTADTYRDIINYFTTNNPDLKVVGLTATPDRADEESLGQIFPTVAYDYEVLDAINDGWLLRPIEMRVRIKDLDFSHIKTTAGDLNQGELSQVMEAEGPIHGVVQATVEVMFGLDPHILDGVEVDDWGNFVCSTGNKAKRTLVFTVSVVQAETLCNILNRVVPGKFDWVCGKTKDEERERLLKRFADGEIYGICNCNCLSEGYDNPGVEVIVQARPTKSRALYAQQCGRGLRPLTGITDGLETVEERIKAILASAKPVATILDFVGNSGKHNLVSAADILGGKVSDPVMDRVHKMLEALENKSTDVVQLVEDAEKAEREEVLKRKRIEEERRKKIIARTTYNVTVVDPFDVFNICPVKPRGWDTGRTLSPKQQAVLRGQGIDPNAFPYAQNRQMLDEIFRRWKAGECGFKVAKNLAAKGLPTKVTTEQAVAMLRGGPPPVQPSRVEPEEGVIFELLPTRDSKKHG